MRRRTSPAAATGAAPTPDEAAAQSGLDDSEERTTLVTTIAASPSELSGLRAQVAAFARGHGAGDDVTGDLELIVSELATNVTRHTDEPDISVTLRVDDIERDGIGQGSARHWTLQMTGARYVPDLDDVDAPPTDQEAGRGLVIVRAVADDVELDRPGGTVKCTLVG